MACHKAGTIYTGDRQPGSGGHNMLITLGSVDEQIMADAIEGGLSFSQATYLVNAHRRECVPRPIDVGRSAVVTAYKRLEPDVSPIQHAKQGSSDAESPSGVARLMFVLQLLVRFGEITGLAAWMWSLNFLPDSAEAAALDISLLPAYFMLDSFGLLSIYQIAFWDECHKEVVIGGKGHGKKNSRSQVCFKRDADSDADSDAAAMATPAALSEA